MEEKNFKENPKNQNYLYLYALKLFNTDVKELEKLFGKYLKRSYDLRFWNLYIEYVTKVSSKKVNVNDVYNFVINHFEYSYFSFVFVRNFISHLSSEGSEDLIRKVYHKALTNPMHNLGQLWNEYEKWEISVNRINARSNIEKIQQGYTQAFSMYQRLIPFIDSNSFFPIIDIELENPLNLSKKFFDSRLSFIFDYYISIFPENEALLFLQSFYIKDKENSFDFNSTFLSYWFSFYYNKNLFNFEDKKNKQLTIVNFLNWTVKNEGINAFRNKFNEMKNQSGVYAYIYAAHVEFYQGCNKKEAYEIFVEALEKFGDSSLLNEEFFKLFLKIGDEENIRLLFKKLKKTELIYDLMIEYEFMHGDMEAYKNLLIQRDEEKNDILLSSTTINNKIIKSKGCMLVYETVLNNFGFLDLKIENIDIITEFISRLPPLSYNENILSNFDSSIIIDILQTI